MDLDTLRRVIAHYPAKIWLIGYVSDVIYKEYRDVKHSVVAKKPERAWNSEGRSSGIDPRTIAAHDG